MCVEARDRNGCMPILPGGGLAWSQAILAGTTGLSAAAARATAPLTEALDIEALRTALRDAHINTLYQPIVRLSDCQPAGVEVLARLQHPDHGMLLPSLFVPWIEDAGLALPFTEAVFRSAFADWSRGRLTALRMTLALNVPLDVMLMPDALTLLDGIRAASGIPAESVVIELTESRPVIRLPELHAAAKRLRALGYGLAIDDVSPSVRDHQALLQMPFTVLKLDKDLVRDAEIDGEARDFLIAAIAAGRASGLSIIAEGIESEANWELMQRLGVDFAQGYMVAYPLPAGAVHSWHASWSALQTQ